MLWIEKEFKKWFDFFIIKVILNEIVLYYYFNNWIKDVRIVWWFEMCYIDFLYLFVFFVWEIVFFWFWLYLWCIKYVFVNFEVISKM